jgi:hypothetical protein
MEASMLLYHLGQHHPDQVEPSLVRMATEDIATVAARRMRWSRKTRRGEIT